MEPADQRSIEYDKRLPHPFTGNELTDKGIAVYCEYMSTIREAIGYDIPLSTDHLGHLGVNVDHSAGPRLREVQPRVDRGRDPVVVHRPAQGDHRQQPHAHRHRRRHLRDRRLRKALPQCTPSSKIHPDLATSGGILRTHKIGDMAYTYGVPMAMHFAGTPRQLHGQRALRRGHTQLPRA